MEKIIQEELNVMIDKHKLWLNKENGGVRADLSNKDCSGLDFSNNDLSFIYLDKCNLTKANLSNCNLEYAFLFGTNLEETDLTGAILKKADFINANLNNTKGLINTEEYMKNNFEFDEERNGYIVYKTFGSIHKSPEYWIIKENSMIKEKCTIDRTYDCGRGINCANLDWVKDYNTCKDVKFLSVRNYNLPIWKLLIKKEWLNGVIIPYSTDGKIRCSKAQLLNIVE